MLTEIYIEALLVDEELADQVWEAWDKGEISDEVAWLGWWLIAHPIKVGQMSCTAACEFSSIRTEQRGGGKVLRERGAIILDEWKAHWSKCSACGEQERPLFMKLQGGMCGKCAPFIYVFRTGVFVLIAGVGGLGLVFLINNPIDMVMTGAGTPRGRINTTIAFIGFAFVGLWGLYYLIWSFSRIAKTSKQGSNRL